MKLVIVSEKVIGEVLSSPIYTEAGVMFLNKGNKLTETTIKRLKKMSVSTIYIEDGKGPLGLTGENIYEFAKVVGICNEYFNITNGDKSILPPVAIDIIVSEAAIKFNSDIYRDSIQSIYCYPNGLPVKLNNGLS